MQWFKTMTTNDYIVGVKEENWPPFNRRLWQRGYYDHIIRNDRALDRIRDYIEANPTNWIFDIRNPDAIPLDKREMDAVMMLEGVA